MIAMPEARALSTSRLLRVASACGLGAALVGALPATKPTILPAWSEDPVWSELVRPAEPPVPGLIDAEQADIGDPWWDDAAPRPAPDASARPAGLDSAATAEVARSRTEQLRLRVGRQRRQAAMKGLRNDLSLLRETSPALDVTARAEILAAGRRAVDEVANVDLKVPPAHVRATLEAAIAAHAGSEMVAAWNREIDKRAERRRRAAIAVILEAVDHSNCLDAERRAAVSAALAKGWQDSWTLALSQAQRPGRGLPPGVAECVAAALDAGETPQSGARDRP